MTLHGTLLTSYFIPAAIKMRILTAVLASVQEDWWQNAFETWWQTVTHGRGSEGETGEWRG